MEAVSECAVMQSYHAMVLCVEHYGFTLDGNPHDVALLPAEIVTRCAPELLAYASPSALQASFAISVQCIVPR